MTRAHIRKVTSAHTHSDKEQMSGTRHFSLEGSPLFLLLVILTSVLCQQTGRTKRKLKHWSPVNSPYTKRWNVAKPPLSGTFKPSHREFSIATKGGNWLLLLTFLCLNCLMPWAKLSMWKCPMFAMFLCVILFGFSQWQNWWNQHQLRFSCQNL